MQYARVVSGSDLGTFAFGPNEVCAYAAHNKSYLPMYVLPTCGEKWGGRGMHARRGCPFWDCRGGKVL